MASTKKKRVSKKNKIAWRKHVDIKDVEEFLEDKRLEERLGDQLETLPDKDIFQVDTKPQDTKRLSTRQRKKLALQAPPKCFSLLQPLTKVPDPLIKRNRVRTKEERQHPIAKRNEEARRLKGIVKAKDKQAAKNREYDRNKKIANKYVKGDFKNDLWEVEDFNPVNLPDKEWLTSDTIRHTYHGLGKMRKSIPVSLTKKKSVVEAVEAPHPGMSYNPSLKDHQALLQEVATAELEKIKHDKHIERVTTKMFKKTTPSKKENAWLTEMSEGIPLLEPEDTEKEEGDYKSINPPVKNVKKDTKQKRKQKEQRQLEKLRLDAKTEKRKIADIYKLKKLNQQIEKQQKKTDKLKQKRIKKKEYEIAEPKVLSKNKFVKPELDFHMGEEISGNLRNLKAEGNLLRDRFKSMQKRNVLQPTVKQPPRKKPKYKKYEKPGHKMGWEPKGF